ncbi:hypothetical protein F4604DRAFT_1674673 [Suillus subluteus]|nr:hypothetical protein F4604DRAFT_1674673 [Suillus subluteus]
MINQTHIVLHHHTVHSIQRDIDDRNGSSSRCSKGRDEADKGRKARKGLVKQQISGYKDGSRCLGMVKDKMVAHCAEEVGLEGEEGISVAAVQEVEEDVLTCVVSLMTQWAKHSRVIINLGDGVYEFTRNENLAYWVCLAQIHPPLSVADEDALLEETVAVSEVCCHNSTLGVIGVLGNKHTFRVMQLGQNYLSLSSGKSTVSIGGSKHQR